jgi:tetratricopeptide (TPR) repeat protein
MSRFSNLEFGEQSDVPSLQQSAVVKDEAFYLAEAQAAYEGGRFEAGLRAYAKALEYGPDNAAAWSGQVRMLIELREYREARLWADKALERFPSDPELLAAKAVALARSGDLGGAMAFSDAAIEERGNTPYVWLARGDVLLARREKRAESCFERAFALAPGNWFFLWLASRIHLVYEQFASALRLARQALELEAVHAVLWLQLGECQLALGLASAARHSLAQAHQLDPACGGLTAARTRADATGWARQLRGWLRRLLQR